VPLAVTLLLVTVVLLSIAALAWAVRLLVLRLGRLGRDLDHLRHELTPALQRIEADGEVTAAELTAIGDRLEARARAATTRRRRRWRPGPS
jgi:hypothetical protein